ncbi:MAG: polyprenyl synthetase family protein [Candidatus Aenigmatarchaeota archaeon]
MVFGFLRKRTAVEDIDIMKILEEKKPIIDAIIEKYIPRTYDVEKMVFSAGAPKYGYNVDAANESISKPVWDLLDRGGKRWRPVLFLLVAEALGGNPEKYLDFVIIPEVVHNGTLAVDDVEDDSELRRGRPCLHKLYGTDVAINAGNQMYFLPLLAFIKNREKLNNETLVKAYEIYSQGMIELGYGQGMDIAWHKGLAGADDVTEKEYLQMCAYKTGTLARMSAKLGALLAGANSEVIEKMGALAEAIGIAFQIQDDILNLTATSGKNQFIKEYIGSDITEGKRTLMVIHALKNANEKDKKRMKRILKMHTRSRKIIKEAIKIVKKCGSVDYAKQFAQNLVQNAWNDVKNDIPDNEAKRKIEAFVKFAYERSY